MTAETYNAIKEMIKPLEAVGFVLKPIDGQLSDVYMLTLEFENYQFFIWESDFLEGKLSVKRILSDLISDAKQDALDTCILY
jgi:hypothetical protein